MSDAETRILSFDYYLEYAVYEERGYLFREPMFVSRDVNEAFRELFTAPGDGQRTLLLLLKDPEGKALYRRELAKVGPSRQWLEEQK